MGLFAKHLSKDILQFGLFVGRKSGDSSFQTTFVNRPYLVSDNFTFPPIYLTSNAIGVTVNGRCDRNNNHCRKVLIQFLGTYNHTRTYFLHFGSNRRIEVNPIYVELVYHDQSSTLSSSNTAASINWSLPASCALRAAADHPCRTAFLDVGASVKTFLRMSRKARRAFFMATSLSKMGLSSRSNSARSCIVVIT